MPFRRWVQEPRLRGPGIIALILGLVHAPLPQPDFHNVRHHDGAGEVCEHHDHLLRWHPNARSADDVAVLHWHWFFAGGSDDASAAPAGGSALHAHAQAPPWPASSWDEGPRFSPVASTRVPGRPTSPLLTFDLLPARRGTRAIVRSGAPPRPLGFIATFVPGASLASLYQRWDC